MSIHVIRSGIFEVNSLVVEFSPNKCFVVDPAACRFSNDQNKILDYLKNRKLDCQGILLTHCHFDHVTGINEIKNAFPKAKIAIHQAEFQDFQNPPGKLGLACINFFGLDDLIDIVSKQAPAELALHEGDDYFGWKVIHTPGHTPGSICLYNQKENSLISGDTLFAYGGYGRTDMEGGNEKEIIKSLERIRREIPTGTKVYPGHEEFAFTL